MVVQVPFLKIDKKDEFAHLYGSSAKITNLIIPAVCATVYKPTTNLHWESALHCLGFAPFTCQYFFMPRVFKQLQGNDLILRDLRA